MNQKCVSLEGQLMGYEKKTLAITAIIVLVALASFYAGAKYEKYKLGTLGLIIHKPAAPVKDNSIKGTVLSINDKGITIKMADGITKEILFAGNMTFGKDGTGDTSDLFIGELLVITGEDDANGNFVPTNMRASKKSPKPPVPTPDSITPDPAVK